jgi:hypothetical protein
MARRAEPLRSFLAAERLRESSSVSSGLLRLVEPPLDQIEPRVPNPGSVRSTPTSLPSSSGDADPPARSSSR